MAGMKIHPRNYRQEAGASLSMTWRSDALTILQENLKNMGCFVHPALAMTGFAASVGKYSGRELTQTLS